MNKRLEDLMYLSGMTAQGCWDSMDDYQRQAVEKFAQLIVKECGYRADVFGSLGCPVDMDPTETKPSDYINKHFGVE
jgi:hypothetical protein